VTRVRIRLAGPAGLIARVRELTAAETACCSFVSFTVTPVSPDAAGPAGDGEALSLDIQVPDSYTHVLDAIVRRVNGAAADGNGDG
jgi:hypothetical protein